MTEELKPCPFCGSDAETDGEWVNCGNMHCTANDYGLLPAHWNTRPIEDALRSRIKELEEACEGIAPWLAASLEEYTHDGKHEYGDACEKVFQAVLNHGKEGKSK